MATLNPPLTPTWRLLGLSVAAGYLGLGSMAVLAPVLSTRWFLGDNLKSTNTGQTTTESADAAEQHARTLLPALGARDMSIGTALAVFHYYDMPRPMAILILSGMVLCAVDIELIYRTRGPRDGILLGAGAAGWGWIGWELLRRTRTV